MAVIAGSELVLRPRADFLDRRLSRERFRRLLSHPLWSLALQVINRTRSYEAGLEGGYLLLELLQKYSSGLSSGERDKYLQQIYGLILSMLDKLDRWEEYLQLSDRLRITTQFEVVYVRPDTRTCPMLGDGLVEQADQSWQRRLWEKRGPFVLREDERHVYLHWLYLGSGRRDLITRKLQRRVAARGRRSDLHARQEDLTEHEMRQRLQEFERIVRSTLATA